MRVLNEIVVSDNDILLTHINQSISDENQNSIKTYNTKDLNEAINLVKEIGKINLLILDDNILPKNEPLYAQHVINFNVNSTFSSHEYKLSKPMRLAELNNILIGIRDNYHTKIYNMINHSILIDELQMRAISNSEATKLTEREFQIIKLLLNNPDHTYSKAEILQHIWGYSDNIQTHTLESHIYNLKNKLSQLPLKISEKGYNISCESLF